MKKAILTVLALALILVSSVSATFAYFIDSDYTVNSFTVGHVSIDFRDLASTGSNKLLPGNSYAKNPVVKVLEDSENCWLFVKVENGIESLESEEDSIASQMEQNGWLPLDSAENVYYYGSIVSAGTELVVFDGFTISPDASSADIAACSGAQIALTAYAMQADGFSTAADAWAKGSFTD